MLRRGIGYTAATAIQALSALLFLPLLTNLASAAEFGTIAAGQLVMQLTAIITTLGIPGLMTRDYFDSSSGPTHARQMQAILLFIVPFLIGILHLTGPLWVRVFGTIEFDAFLALALWAAWPRTIVVGAGALFRAEQRVGAFVQTSVASLVGSQLLALGSFWLGKSVTFYFIGFLVGHTIAAVLALLWSQPVFTDWKKNRRVTSTVRLSIPIVANSAAALVITTGDRVIIERLLGLDAVGRYQVTYMIGSLGIVLMLAVNNAWGPMVFAAPDGTAESTLARTTLLASRLAFRVMLGLVAGGPILLSVIAPDAYQLEDLMGTMTLIALSTLPLTFYLAGNHLALLTRQTSRLAIATAFAASANVGLNVVLIPPFGLQGAACATLLSYASWAALLHWNERSRKIDWSIASLTPELVTVITLLVLLQLTPIVGIWIVFRGAITLGAGVAVLYLGLSSRSQEFV